MANYHSVDVNAINQQDQSMLMKHVAFFDRNKDGVIYPWETFAGLRAIGCGVLFSAVGAIGINVGLSGLTRPGKLPSPLFPIEVKNIALAKHGSDTGVYDKDGRASPMDLQEDLLAIFINCKACCSPLNLKKVRFVQEKFDEIFSKHAHLNKNALTFLEVQFLLNANRNDFVGGIAAFLEWNVLYFLCKDQKGLLQKETIMGVYDGTLFEQMAQQQEEAKKPKQ